MIESGIFRFEETLMQPGESHGGLGQLWARRVANQSAESNVRHIDLVVIEPGASIASHQHGIDNEEIYIIIKGEGRMHIEHDQVSVVCGDVIRNKPSGTHGFENTGPNAVWIVVIEFSTTT